MLSMSVVCPVCSKKLNIQVRTHVSKVAVIICTRKMIRKTLISICGEGGNARTVSCTYMRQNRTEENRQRVPMLVCLCGMYSRIAGAFLFFLPSPSALESARAPQMILSSPRLKNETGQNKKHQALTLHTCAIYIPFIVAS